MKRVRYQRQSGQALVEALAALAIVILLLTGLVVGTVVSLARTSSSKFMSRAVQQAEENLEIIRAYRDESWTDFESEITGKTFCGDSGTLVVKQDGVPCPANPQGYRREVTVSTPTVNGIARTVSVTSKVYWTERSSEKNVVLETKLTNWKNYTIQPTPP